MILLIDKYLKVQAVAEVQSRLYRLVRGGVIDDENLRIDTTLDDNRLETSLDEVLPFERRHDHREERGASLDRHARLVRTGDGAP